MLIDIEMKSPLYPVYRFVKDLICKLITNELCGLSEFWQNP